MTSCPRLFLGGMLAVLVILAFLRRISATVIIALAIPISVIVTFAPMYVLDVSLNIMSLGGLALGIGMLVDNAIVVLESITRCREEGDTLDGRSSAGRERSGGRDHGLDPDDRRGLRPHRVRTRDRRSDLRRPSGDGRLFATRILAGRRDVHPDARAKARGSDPVALRRPEQGRVAHILDPARLIERARNVIEDSPAGD